MTSLAPIDTTKQSNTYILTNSLTCKDEMINPEIVDSLTHNGHSVIIVDQDLEYKRAVSVQNETYRRVKELYEKSKINPSIRLISKRPTNWEWVIDYEDIDDRDNVFYIDYSNHIMVPGMTEELFVMSMFGKYNRNHSYMMNVPFDQIPNLKKINTYDYYSGKKVGSDELFDMNVMILLIEALMHYQRNSLHISKNDLPIRMEPINIYNYDEMTISWPMIMEVPALACLELSKKMLPSFIPKYDNLSGESCGLNTKEAMATMGTYRVVFCESLALILSNFVVNNDLLGNIRNVDWLNWQTWEGVLENIRS